MTEQFGLISHGITEWNCLGKAQGLSDIPLNELGREQALNAGQRLLQEENWNLIVTNDLIRATETTLQRLLPQVFQKTYIDNTSVTILSNSKGKWHGSLFNCTKPIS